MMKHINKNIKKMVIYCTLIMAMLNACLRFNESGTTALFRLFSPFVVFLILVKYFNAFKKEVMFVIGMILYSIVVSCFFYKNISLEYILFVVYIFFEYVLVKYIKIVDENFDINFMRFIHNWTLITLGLCWLQFFLRFKLPFLELPSQQGVNVYLSNENEMGEALSCVLIIYLFMYIFFKKKKYFLPIICIIFFLFVGDVKLSLLGVLTATVIFYIYKLYYRFWKRNVNPRFYLFMVIVVAISGIGGLLVVNPSLKFRDYNITIVELLFQPIQSILTLEPMKSVGSINDRVNAIVFGIKELLKTKGIGIGLGNSIKMLELPQYHLLTAKSMHNIIAQFLVEFGYLALVIYFSFLHKTITGFLEIKRTKICLLKSTFLIAFIFISSQSSIGILSNYYTIAVVIYIVLMEKNDLMLSKL